MAKNYEDDFLKRVSNEYKTVSASNTKSKSNTNDFLSRVSQEEDIERNRQYLIRKAQEDYQNEINNRSAVEWLSLYDESNAKVKQTQNALLKNLQDNNINARVSGRTVTSAPTFKNNLEVGKQTKFDNTNLQSNYDNTVNLFNYKKTDE